MFPFSIFLLNIDTMVLKHPSPWLVPLSPGSCRVWSTCQDQDAGDDPLGCTAQAVPVASGPTIDVMPWIIGMLDGLSRTSSTYCKSIKVHKKRAILQRYDEFAIGFKLFSEFVLEDFIFMLKVYNSINFRSGGCLFSRYFDFSKSKPGLGGDRPRSLLSWINRASTWCDGKLYGGSWFGNSNISDWQINCFSFCGHGMMLWSQVFFSMHLLKTS